MYLYLQLVFRATTRWANTNANTTMQYNKQQGTHNCIIVQSSSQWSRANNFKLLFIVRGGWDTANRFSSSTYIEQQDECSWWATTIIQKLDGNAIRNIFLIHLFDLLLLLATAKGVGLTKLHPKEWGHIGSSPPPSSPRYTRPALSWDGGPA